MNLQNDESTLVALIILACIGGAAWITFIAWLVQP